MDIRQWQPHGLIVDPGLEMPYRDAKQSIDEYGNEKDPKEHCTVHLFEDFFREIFKESGYYINSQVPPASKKGSEKAGDLAIKYLTADYQHQIFCFAEAKRAKNHTHAKIRGLEEQARGYCRDFLEAYPDVDVVYACTLVGASIRCWSVSRDKQLTPFWDGPEGTFERYMDVGEDRYAEHIMAAFNHMKSIPIGGNAGIPLGMNYGDIGRHGATVSAPTYTAPYTARTPMVNPAVTSTGASGSYAMNVDEPGGQGVVGEPGGQGAGAELLEEDYVEVKVRTLGLTIADTVYRFTGKNGKLEKLGSEFQTCSFVDSDGNERSYWVYEGRTSGTKFWTWTLDPKLLKTSKKHR